MLSLMREIREAIGEDRFPHLKEQFLATYQVADYQAGKRDRKAWLSKLGASEGVSND
jgi:hypothetical protein